MEPTAMLVAQLVRAHAGRLIHLAAAAEQHKKSTVSREYLGDPWADSSAPRLTELAESINEAMVSTAFDSR